MKFINLTPHVVVIKTENGSVKIPYGAAIARVMMVKELVGTIDSIPIWNVTTGEVIDLPDSSEGIGYVVSAMVRLTLPARKDLFSPGDLIRDENGVVIGCEGLIKN